MARKVIRVTIETEGRDKGKTFEITEMSALQAERWATRALLAVSRSNIDIPEDVAKLGLAGVAMIGTRLLSSISYADAAPLLDELLGCVKIVMPVATRACVEDDFEEVTTLLQLRAEVFKLHTSFLKAATPLISGLVSAAQDGLSSTQMSPGQSVQ